MKKITFNAHNALSNLLPAGVHICNIASVESAEAKESDLYSDRTPQLKVQFKSDDGTISQWFNLMGYESDENGDYIIKGGKRVEDKEKTAKALSIVGKLGLDAGIAKGSDFVEEDLVGMSVGIFVVDSDGKVKVKYTMTSDRAEEKALELSEDTGAFEG